MIKPLVAAATPAAVPAATTLPGGLGAEAADKARGLNVEADLNARLALCEALLAELVPERGRHREQANGEQSSGCASTVTQTATSRLKPLAVHTGLLLLGGPTADGAGHGLLRETGPRPHAADDEVKPPEQESTKPQQAQARRCT